MCMSTTQPVEAEELAIAIRRMISALSKRARIDGDLVALSELADLMGYVDIKLHNTVQGLRHHEIYPASWQEIADAMGVTKKAAISRFGYLGGKRQRGGQPGTLR